MCKYHICGFCPHEEFDKTRTDFGPCPLVHDDRSKGQWEALSDEERAKHPYERDLKKWLDKMVDDLGKKVKRNQERLDSEANPAFLPDDQVGSTLLRAPQYYFDQLLYRLYAHQFVSEVCNWNLGFVLGHYRRHGGQNNGATGKLSNCW